MALLLAFIVYTLYIHVCFIKLFLISGWKLTAWNKQLRRIWAPSRPLQHTVLHQIPPWMWVKADDYLRPNHPVHLWQVTISWTSPILLHTVRSWVSYKKPSCKIPSIWKGKKHHDSWSSFTCSFLCTVSPMTINKDVNHTTMDVSLS